MGEGGNVVGTECIGQDLTSKDLVQVECWGMDLRKAHESRSEVLEAWVCPHLNSEDPDWLQERATTGEERREVAVGPSWRAED